MDRASCLHLIQTRKGIGWWLSNFAMKFDKIHDFAFCKLISNNQIGNSNFWPTPLEKIELGWNWTTQSFKQCQHFQFFWAVHFPIFDHPLSAFVIFHFFRPLFVVRFHFLPESSTYASVWNINVISWRTYRSNRWNSAFLWWFR